MHIGYQPKLHVYLVGVLAKGFLEIVGTRYTRLKLRAALHKAVCPPGTDRLHTTHRKEGIRHIFHTTNPGQKSLHI